MLYRNFPKMPEMQVSVLGFGLMRLPVKPDSSIDYDKTKELVSLAFEQGINYFDTAYPYHGGTSETVFGQIVKELGIRQKIYIADKLPVWDVDSKEKARSIFETQLERLQTDHIDFYLLHALGKDHWEKVKKLDILSLLDELKESGKIRHIGFSFHDTPEVFEKIIDEYESAEFCQVQYNYLDGDIQGTAKDIAYAAERNIGTIVMEPLRGGLLAMPPKGVIDIFAHAEKPRTPSEWALRWVLENQEVVCALSGMNSVDQLMMNCATASCAKPNSLPSKQLKVVESAADWFKHRIKVSCTGCRYCMPCPKNVDIPAIFAEWNRMSMTGALEDGPAVSGNYVKIKNDGHGADLCVSCRKCESLCPQKIKISEQLVQVRKSFKD
ncbi:MAG: aldo/keto reductase [Treponemataceae bacterium]|nr:aldo/keto reductase [Treponemataceae bacterium]